MSSALIGLAYVVAVMAVIGIGGALILAIFEPLWERVRVYLAERRGW